MILRPSTPAHRSETPIRAQDGAELKLSRGPTKASTALEVVDQVTTSGGSETPVREVDRINGNKARAIRQRERVDNPRVVEAEDGSIHRTKAVSLVIPAEKRCRALTVHGVRCRAGKMRGMETCVFHAHHALSDEALAALASDPEGSGPRLTPRKALRAVVTLKGQELAEAAVEAALHADGVGKTRAVISLLDAVDPLLLQEETLTLSPEGAEKATYRQLLSTLGPTALEQ